MKKTLLLLLLISSVAIGCATSKVPLSVPRGDHFSTQDHARLQQLANDVLVTQPTSWTHRPVPSYVYHLDNTVDYRAISKVALPDLTLAIDGPKDLGRALADRMAKDLVEKRLIKEVARGNGPADLTLIGVIDGDRNTKPGKKTSPVRQRGVRAEFRVLAGDRPVGAIQLNAIAGTGFMPAQLIVYGAEGGEVGRLAGPLN